MAAAGEFCRSYAASRTPTSEAHRRRDVSIEEDRQRYVAAVHGMQSGVAMKMNYDGKETEPKHLRVGVNNAMADHGSLAKLLIDKGVITDEEYFKAIADGAERERDLYQQWLQDRLGGSGTTIHLG